MTNGPTSEALVLRKATSVRARVRRIPRWLVLGLLIRLALMPFHHPWDLQTWYNMFVDLAQGYSPYDTFHDLTASYRAQQWLMQPGESLNAVAPELFYAYYAYPPLLMMLYYPFAKIAQLVIPLEHQFTMHGPAAQVVVSPLFHFFFKPPLFLAELGIALLLWVCASENTARRFFLNPLVILVSATWTVDALMAFFVVLSIYLVHRKSYFGSAVALAAGTLTKFLPGVLLPAVLLFLWHRGVSRRIISLYAATFIVICIATVAPFWSGVREALLFQTVRPGANLSLHFLLYPLTQFTRLDMRFLSYVASPLIGTVTQVSALVLAYGYLARRRHTLTQTYIITLLAFMLGAKVVNESYLYVLVPLLALELTEHPSEAKENVLRLLYSLPLAFAFINVPIVYFAMPFYRYFWKGSYPVSYDWARYFPVKEHAVILTTLAIGFVAACAYSVAVMIKEGKHDEGVVAAS